MARRNLEDELDILAAREGQARLQIAVCQKDRQDIEERISALSKVERLYLSVFGIAGDIAAGSGAEPLAVEHAVVPDGLGKPHPQRRARGW